MLVCIKEIVHRGRLRAYALGTACTYLGWINHNESQTHGYEHMVCKPSYYDHTNRPAANASMVEGARATNPKPE